jgi:hypothetical protein
VRTKFIASEKRAPQKAHFFRLDSCSAGLTIFKPLSSIAWVSFTARVSINDTPTSLPARGYRALMIFVFFSSLLLGLVFVAGQGGRPEFRAAE